MYMQTFSRISCYLLTIVPLAGCRKAASDPSAQSGKDAERIDCAVNGARDFTRVCAIERAAGPNGLILVVRHPDGGFRRLQVVTDGRGVVAADGSEVAAVGIAGDKRIEVTLGKDSYRLPATVKRPGR